VAAANLVPTLAALQASCEHTAATEAKAKQVKAAATALELHLTDIIGVTPPPSTPRPADVAAPTPPIPVINDTFLASTIACLHA
jgi:hypothetical protein